MIFSYSNGVNQLGQQIIYHKMPKNIAELMLNIYLPLLFKALSNIRQNKNYLHLQYQMRWSIHIHTYNNYHN